MEKDKSVISDEALPKFNHEVVHARYVAGVVASRLRRIDELARRLQIEEAPISSKEYRARLLRKKEELTRIILDADLPHRQSDRPAIHFSPGSRISGLYQTAEPSLPHGVEIRTDISLYRGRCSRYEGYVMPLAWRGRHDTGCIAHDSTFDFGIDERLFEQTGGIIFSQSLNDDAAWWRDDTPDSYRASFEVYWELPQPNCDVEVQCLVDVYHHFDFTNAADDGGGFATSVAMVHSDENGAFGEYDLRIIQVFLLGNLGEQKSSGTYDSGRSGAGIRFQASKQSIIRVALGHFSYLWAQDGLVESLGTMGTHNTDCISYCTPQLKYSMFPTG